jgi:hypothetical protein
MRVARAVVFDIARSGCAVLFQTTAQAITDVEACLAYSTG